MFKNRQRYSTGQKVAVAALVTSAWIAGIATLAFAGYYLVMLIWSLHAWLDSFLSPEALDILGWVIKIMIVFWFIVHLVYIKMFGGNPGVPVDSEYKIE